MDNKTRIELERRLAIPRIYRTDLDGLIEIIIEQYKIHNIGKISPSAKFSYDKKSSTLECTDFCIDGPGEQIALAEQWELQLPYDYLEFCALFSEYFIIGKTPIHIMGPEEISIYTTTPRLAQGVAKDAPIRIVSFAHILGNAAGFAFRWTTDDGIPDIVYIWDYADIEENILLGEEGSRFVTDASFTDWLARILKSDAWPIFPGELLPTSFGVIEADLPAMIPIA